MDKYQELNNLGTLRQSFHFKVSPENYGCCMGNPGRPKKLFEYTPVAERVNIPCNNSKMFSYCNIPNNLWDNKCEVNPKRPSVYSQTSQFNTQNQNCTNNYLVKKYN